MPKFRSSKGGFSKPGSFKSGKSGFSRFGSVKFGPAKFGKAKFGGTKFWASKPGVGKFGASKSAKKGAASKGVLRGDAVLIWGLLGIVIVVSLAEAAFSPLLAWRQPVYIAAGFAGVLAMAFLLLQPLLAGGYLPGLAAERGRRLHRWIGIALVIAVAVHVGGLAITSPPDVVDVLLFRSPTPFALWGVIALWAVLLAALIAALRTSLALRPRTWRRIHTTLALITVIASVVHAVLIEGTMETVSKVLLCAAAVGATVKVIVDLKVWVGRTRSGVRKLAGRRNRA